MRIMNCTLARVAEGDEHASQLLRDMEKPDQSLVDRVMNTPADTLVERWRKW